MKTENLYVNAVLLYLNFLQVEELEISALEICGEMNPEFKDMYSDEDRMLLNHIQNAQKVRIHQINRLCRLILREHVWCKLSNGDEIYVHFGYDYYMYVGTLKLCSAVIRKIEKIGLYVEPYESPYREEEE